MADQMRRRERAQKRDLLLWRAGMRRRMGAQQGGEPQQGKQQQQQGTPLNGLHSGGSGAWRAVSDPSLLPPDREARTAAKAAGQAARVAATLIGAQVHT